jgi:hypothetical protein
VRLLVEKDQTKEENGLLIEDKMERKSVYALVDAKQNRNT